MKQITYLQSVLGAITSLDDLCAQIEKHKLGSQDVADYFLVYWYEKTKDPSLSEEVNRERFSLRFDYYSRKHYLSTRAIQQAIQRLNRLYSSTLAHLRN